jgi:hypothetical protein
MRRMLSIFFALVLFLILVPVAYTILNRRLMEATSDLKPLSQTHMPAYFPLIVKSGETFDVVYLDEWSSVISSEKKLFSEKNPKGNFSEYYSNRYSSNRWPGVQRVDLNTISDGHYLLASQLKEDQLRDLLKLRAGTILDVRTTGDGVFLRAATPSQIIVSYSLDGHQLKRPQFYELTTRLRALLGLKAFGISLILSLLVLTFLLWPRISDSHKPPEL